MNLFTHSCMLNHLFRRFKKYIIPLNYWKYRNTRKQYIKKKTNIVKENLPFPSYDSIINAKVQDYIYIKNR